MAHTVDIVATLIKPAGLPPMRPLTRSRLKLIKSLREGEAEEGRQG
jgi:hypothetical protein